MPTEPCTHTRSASSTGADERVQQPLGDLLAVVVVDVLEQHRELVAAEPRGEVAGAHRGGDPVGDRHQHRVAGRVAVLVVDRLEVVEVEEQHRRLAALAPQRLAEAAQELRPVAEPGERVRVGLHLEALLQLAHARDGLLEPVVLEREPGVVGERLEQPQVLAR